MKTLSAAFLASLASFREQGRTLTFTERVEIDWSDDTTISYSPLDTSGTRQTPLMDDNPYWAELPDADGTIASNVRRKVQVDKAMRVYVSFDGGATEELDYEGTISSKANIRKDSVRLNARGIFAGLGSNGTRRIGSREYHRRYVDATDGLYDEVGSVPPSARKRIGSRV